VAHGQYTHIEIPYDDEVRAKAFYTAVFGWQFKAMDGYEGYSTYESGPGDLGGGIGKRGITAPATVRNYVDVDDIDASIAAIPANGGTIVEPRTDMGFGWYAVFKDSEGNELALYQPKQRS
jgi:predicted enzyme related to lactoylglutathione lyase